jgi:hypothetical protein
MPSNGLLLPLARVLLRRWPKCSEYGCGAPVTHVCRYNSEPWGNAAHWPFSYCDEHVDAQRREDEMSGSEFVRLDVADDVLALVRAVEGSGDD